MVSGKRVMRASRHKEIILGAGALSISAALLALCFAGQDFIVAEQPLALFPMGVPFPAFAFQWLLPIATVLLLLVVALRPNGHWIWAFLSTLIVVALVSVWAVSLVRHDRWLSLFHSALLVGAVWLAAWRQVSAKWLCTTIAALSAAVIAFFSFGAIWGETRCDERGYVNCLVTEGPKIWVPKLFSAIRLATFADLRGNDLQKVDLSERDLRYADLRSADLRRADLSESNLRRARADNVNAEQSIWRNAYLTGATLSGAILAGSDLRKIHAYRVDLSGADLEGADLRRASLSHANLRGAKLSGTRLQGTYLRFVDGLTQTQLDTACGDENTRLPPGFTISACNGRYE